MEGKGRLTPTGKLGEVMQESAQAAMSYIRSRSAAFGLTRISIATSISTCTFPRAPFLKTVLRRVSHLHVHRKRAYENSCALRRDHDRRNHLARQGLPIGGVKEKLLAAHRMGLRTIVLRRTMKGPSGNPAGDSSPSHDTFVETMDEVLQIALERPLCRLSMPRLRPSRHLSWPTPRKTRV